MDVADPFCEISSTTRLLFWSRGGPAPAASPSKAEEAPLRGIFGTPNGYKEHIEQSKLAMKGYSDTQVVNLDDEGNATAATNYNNNQQGRRPAGERKRRRFTMKHPTTPSKALPVIDRSVLQAITDPDEYFEKEAELDDAEAEIMRLNGEVQRTRTINFEPVGERKRRNPSRARPKKSFISSDPHTSSESMLLSSQSENMKESQMSQDDAHASVYEKNKQSVPSRSNKCAILEFSQKEDSFAGKDKGDEITNIMASFQNFEGPNRLDFIQKSIGIGKVGIEKIYGRDSVLGDMPLGSTARMNQEEVTLPGSHEALFSELSKHIFGDAPVDEHNDLLKDDGFESHTLEGPLPGSQQASELAERISGGAIDKRTDVLKDDECEGSPDILLAEQSPVHNFSYGSVMSDEAFSAREKYREAPGSGAKSAEHLDPEPNMPDRATIDDDPCSRHTISTEEDNVPVGYSVNDKSNIEAVISSHHLEDASAEVLANTPGRDVAPDDIARTSHSSENNIQHQEVVEEDGAVQDKSVHSLKMPLEEIGAQNQSQASDEAIKKLRADLACTLSPIKEKTKKRRKKVADESSHSLEMPQAESDNQRNTHDVNTEKSALSPTKEDTQKAGQWGKKKQQPKRGKKVTDESHHSLEMPQSDFNSENEPHTHDVNTEQQTVVTRNASSPNKPDRQKEGQSIKRKGLQKWNRRNSLDGAGLNWQSGVRRSTRIRHRPLEQWRGERFLYGRIHHSLITVIGVKSYSPGEDGESALKVKSFVPARYSDIVAQSAEH